MKLCNMCRGLPTQEELKQIEEDGMPAGTHPVTGETTHYQRVTAPHELVLRQGRYEGVDENVYHLCDNCRGELEVSLHVTDWSEQELRTFMDDAGIGTRPPLSDEEKAARNKEADETIARILDKYGGENE